MRTYLFSLLCIISINSIAQEKSSYKIAIAAFYNCENFYDTIKSLYTDDKEFTPQGEKNYNSLIYETKVTRLATVISKIGTDDNPANPDGPAIIGLAEIENKNVLTDLINHPLLKKRAYEFVHYEGKDPRGIEVALLYNPKYFTVEDSKPLYVYNRGHYIRDILWVKGKLDGETIHIYVNHWPSRLGGEETTAPNRAAAARRCKKHIDSLIKADGEQKIIIMGDLNDDPISPSVTEVLNAKAKPNEVTTFGLFNPWIDLYKKGFGTLAYQDAWGLFDQIIISRPWLDKNQHGFFYYQPHVYNKEFITENSGKYKGYPMRSWDGNTYRGGYSDHFPVYIVLLKKVGL